MIPCIFKNLHDCFWKVDITFGFLTFKNVTFIEFNIATKSFCTNIHYCLYFMIAFFLGTFMNLKILLKAKWFTVFEVVIFVRRKFLEKCGNID